MPHFASRATYRARWIVIRDALSRRD